MKRSAFGYKGRTFVGQVMEIKSLVNAHVSRRRSLLLHDFVHDVSSNDLHRGIDCYIALLNAQEHSTPSSLRFMVVMVGELRKSLGLCLRKAKDGAGSI